MKHRYRIRTECTSCGETNEGILPSERPLHTFALELNRLPGTHQCGEHVAGILRVIRVEEVFEKEGE